MKNKTAIQQLASLIDKEDAQAMSPETKQVLQRLRDYSDFLMAVTEREQIKMAYFSGMCYEKTSIPGDIGPADAYYDSMYPRATADTV